MKAKKRIGTKLAALAVLLYVCVVGGMIPAIGMLEAREARAEAERLARKIDEAREAKMREVCGLNENGAATVQGSWVRCYDHRGKLLRVVRRGEK